MRMAGWRSEAGVGTCPPRGSGLWGGWGTSAWTAPQTLAPLGLGQAPEGPEERRPQTSAGLQG